MKTLKAIFSLMMVVLLTCGSNAQTTSKSGPSAARTESFKVYGNCDMCKSRIEAGLKMDGIKKAAWDEKTKMVTVTYDPSKITVDAMQKKVASIGHDTDKYHAPDNVYAKLPDCCHYERAK
ncbi:MAG: heavy metal-associated domain-containing protein [Bacteroidales bacterium]|jgi:copper chaperone CopZ